MVTPHPRPPYYSTLLCFLHGAYCHPWEPASRRPPKSLHLGIHTFVLFFPTFLSGLGTIEYGRSDGLSLPRLGDEGFPLDCSLRGNPAAKLWAPLRRGAHGEGQSLMIMPQEWSWEQIPPSQTNLQMRPQPSWQLDCVTKDPTPESLNYSAPRLWFSGTVR